MAVTPPPGTRQVYPALISDLEERGLLDSTLVLVMGEMGRSPRVNAKAGREHWPRRSFRLRMSQLVGSQLGRRCRPYLTRSDVVR